MNETLVIPKAHSPAPESKLGSRLPTDLLYQSSGRLRWACLIYAGTYFLAFFVPFGIWLASGKPTGYNTFPTVVAVLSISFALFVYWISKWERLSVDQVLDLGLVFEVVGSLGISVGMYWMAFDGHRPAPQGNDLADIPLGISWVCVWIVVFPLIVPTTLKKTFVAAFLSALTGPLALAATWIQHGLPWFLHGSLTDGVMVAFYLSFPSFLCVAMALVVCDVVFNLSRRLHQARRMGSYRLVHRLGQGGMGEVWRAEHRFLARPAAIKLIRPETLGRATPGEVQALLQRFEREAQVIATLTSPHTVALFDFGVTEDRIFYAVMEMLDGYDLDTLVRRFGPLSAERTVYLLRQACLSLMEAHERMLIHRDIKPANLFAGRTGLSYDFLKVLDFGLVKHETRQNNAPDITQEGITPGTPRYMAPEQAMATGSVDHRVDIYGLGCVAYWLLSGSHVFEGATPIEIVAKHIQTAPVPPSSRSELPVPPELDEIVLGCLAKSPGDRIPSARELEYRLRAIPFERPWSQERAARWWATNAPVPAGAETAAS